MQNLLNDLMELLKENEKYVSEGSLLKNVIIEDAFKLEPKLLELLVSDNKIKKHFFQVVGKTLVFDKIKFQKFISNKSFLPDSYTAFKNKIGLNVNDEFISENNDVVLTWPYKDCVLEGGQDKEDAKRDEIFWNETLAPDEIDRLLSPKVLTNWKKYDKDGEHEVDGISENDNLIIKGNNLLGLSSILKRYRGKVKLIYIDPPYNTENDSFKYNDKFTHSTWITFIKNRLFVAKQLLKNDGSIFIQCDNNEHSYLKVLCDEILGRENFRNNIVWKKVLSAKKQSNNLSNVTEHILLYSRSNTFSLKKLFLEAEEAKDLKNYPYIEENTGRRYGSFDFTQKGKGETRIFNGKELKPPKGKHWIWDQNKIDEGIKNNVIIFTKNGTPRVKRYLDEKEGNPLSDLWIDEEVKIISANDKERLEFDGQKPEFLIKRIIELSTAENDLVVDFFAGTGTTAATAQKLKRKWILLEQIYYDNADCIKRLKKVIKGEQTGISKAVNWQGGGSFIYCELAKANQKYVDKITEAEDNKALLKIWKTMQEKAFISYRVDIKLINDNVSEFEKLTLEYQKRFLIEILDKNMLYVPYSEIDDEDYGITETDKILNCIFYGKK